VVDLLADALRNRATCTFCPVTITTGHAPALAEGAGLLLPKKELVGCLQVLLQARRLQVPRSLPEAVLLGKELENFKIRPPSVKEDDLAAWREGPHDDLVLAIALAAWLGELALPPLDDEV
jgi:hypothetical protein